MGYGFSTGARFCVRICLSFGTCLFDFFYSMKIWRIYSNHFVLLEVKDKWPWVPRLLRSVGTVRFVRIRGIGGMHDPSFLNVTCIDYISTGYMSTPRFEPHAYTTLSTSAWYVKRVKTLQVNKQGNRCWEDCAILSNSLCAHFRLLLTSTCTDYPDCFSDRIDATVSDKRSQ